MYLYLHDEAYAKLHDRHVEEQKKKKETDVSLHGKYNVDNVDFSVIEKIAEELPMSSRRRPQWDFDQLVQLGFTDIRVEIRGGKLPMGFLIAARKAEVQLGSDDPKEAGVSFHYIVRSVDPDIWPDISPAVRSGRGADHLDGRKP